MKKEVILKVLAEMEFVVTGKGGDLVLFEKDGVYFDLTISWAKLAIQSNSIGRFEIEYKTVAELKKILKKY